MKRILIIAGLLFILLAAGLAAAWWWLSTTRAGAEWLLERTAAGVERLEWQRLEGGLARGIVLTNVQFEHGGLRASAGRMELAARTRPGWPLRVRVTRLRLHEVDVRLPPMPDVPDPVAPFRLHDLSSPVTWIFDGVELSAIRVHPAEGETLEITRLRLAGRYAQNLSLDRFHLELPYLDLDARGEWALRDPWAVRLHAEAVIPLEDGVEQRVRLEALGPLADISSSVAAEGPLDLHGNARVTGLPQAPAVELVLAGRAAGWPGVDGALEEVSLTLGGRTDDWNLDAGFNLDWPGLPAARARLEAGGDLEQVDLRRMVIDILDGSIDASGRLTRVPKPSAELALRLSDLDFTALYPEWPRQARVSGGMELAWDGRLAVREIQLRAPPSALAVTGRADVDPREDRLEAELEWLHFTWPPVLDDQPPLMTSESGRLRASGRLSDWRMELETLLRVPGQPAARLDLRAGGDTSAAAIERATLTLDDGARLDARGGLAWEPRWRGALLLEIRKLDPALVRTELPGEIDADLELEFEALEPFALRLDLDHLAGAVRGQPVSGRGRVVLGGSELEQGQLNLALGDNRLALASPDGNAWDLELEAPALDQLWPDLYGALHLDGEFLAGEGRARVSGRGEALGLAELRLERAELDARAHWGEQPGVDLSVTLIDLDLSPWERLDRVELGLAGGCDGHRLEVVLTGTRGSLDAAASGALPNCLDHPRVWDGRLEHMFVGDTPAGDWRLDGDLPVRIEPAGMAAGPGCLAAAAGPGRLCLEEFATAPNNRAVVALDAVPVDLFLLAIDPVIALDSPLDGRMELHWDGHGLERIDGRLALGRGTVRDPGSELELLVIERVEVELSTPAPRALEARFEAAIEGDSRVSGRAWTGDLRVPADMVIEADARLDLPDLGAFNRLFPELDELGGRLSGELELAGPASEPDFTGRLALREGLVTYAPIGLRLIEIHADLEADRNHGDLAGRFRAGDGNGRIDGRLVRENTSWLLELALVGEKLKVSELDWLELNASPDLRLALRPQRMELNGDILITRARLGLPPGTEDRVGVSPDVVVVGEEESEPELLPARALSGRVDIRLGEDVRLNAADLRTRLAGEIGLVWRAGEARPRGRGIIRLEDGSYRAYGQTLAVDDGQVIFTGHPLDNPRLDIRAVREIYGDTQVAKAGVHLIGPARDPRVDLYTDPPTTEEKALAYIITGSAFEPSEGQGAFNVGFYLLPKLFVSYGLGLFETGSELSARYQLSRRWGVRVTSGERDSGAEIGFLHDQ